MLPKPKRIGELQALIEKLNQEIQETQSKAKAYFEHGRRYTQKLEEYSAPMLEANSKKLRNLLANQPVTTLAGWNDKNWQAWDVSTAREEAFIRIGELVETRADDGFLMPAYVPFIGRGKTIILKSGGNSVGEGVALLQSLLVRTALMLPHQARYTLLDPAGNGIAFPMRRYLPQVQESTGDVRRDLDQVTVQIQRIIETYLDASITSFEHVPPEIRINEKFQFVFAADFPNQYDRRAIEALQSIGNTGPAAGVYLFIHYNQNYELPRDISMDGFKNAFHVDAENGGRFTKLNLRSQIDSAPPADLQAQLFQKLKDSKPPERILDWDSLVGVAQSDWWRETSTRIIETPIGARGGVDQLKLWFGVNHEEIPCAHGMLGAMTGSGKSNLYHVLICGLAVRYSCH